MSKKFTTEEFIKKSVNVHGKKYDYSKFIYNGVGVKGIIICPKHGEFNQLAYDHFYNKSGCPKCKNESTHKRCNKGIKQFIIESKKIHNNRYNYSKSIYINAHRKIEIICKRHGSWWQAPLNHLKGKGCPKCKCKSSIGEIKISKFLKNNKIEFITEKMFDDCRSPKTHWKLKFDFYIPSKNLLIEYDGMQHFKTLTFGKHKFTLNDLKYLKYKDKIKTRYAKLKGIKLLRIKYTHFNRIDKILESVLKA